MATIDEVIHRYMREKESDRRAHAGEDISKDRIQKDRDVSEVRRQTAKDVAEIRSKASKDRFELGQIIEERKSAELDWKIARARETDARKQSDLDKKYALKDRELAQRQLEQSQKIEHWTTQEELARDKYENPPPAKPPMDRIEITLPDGSKQVLHRGQPGWDEYQRQQEAQRRTSDAQIKADEGRNWWQRFRGMHIPIPPQTGTNPPASVPIVPWETNSMRPPPIGIPDTSTGTTIPRAIVPSQIPGVGNGMAVPPMPTTNIALPGIGRQMTAPTPLPPSEDLAPSSDFLIPDNPGGVTIPEATAPAAFGKYIIGRKYKGGLKYLGGDPMVEASWEKSQ